MKSSPKPPRAIGKSISVSPTWVDPDGVHADCQPMWSGAPESPGVAYAAAGGLLLALVLWRPTPAFRQLSWILLFAALLALGVTVLRRQTAVAFPGVQRGDAIRELRERRDAARAHKPATGVRAPAPAAAPRPAPHALPAPSRAVVDLERLVVLHDSGQLSDTEFASAKTQVINGS